MNVDGYIRVSHRSSTNFVSAGTQRDEIEAFCALHGHHVTENLADTDQLDLWIVNGGSGIRIRLRADRPRGHGSS